MINKNFLFEFFCVHNTYAKPIERNCKRDDKKVNSSPLNDETIIAVTEI